MDDRVETARPGEVLEGRYANFFQVGHNAFEFLIDFGQLYPDENQGQVHTRIVTSPAYIQELMKVLRDSVEKYEQRFGTIPKG